MNINLTITRLKNLIQAVEDKAEWVWKYERQNRIVQSAVEDEIHHPNLGVGHRRVFGPKAEFWSAQTDNILKLNTDASSCVEANKTGGGMHLNSEKLQKNAAALTCLRPFLFVLALF